MKKTSITIIFLALILAMIFSFSNCGKNNNDNGAGGNNPVSNTSINLAPPPQSCNSLAEVIQVINGVGTSLALQYFNPSTQFQFTTDPTYTGRVTVFINGYSECNLCISIAETGQSFTHAGIDYNFNKQLTGLQPGTTYTVNIVNK